ncbi:MAG: hypothetical protein ABR548_11400 [Actinomycetota bacterium]|nr:hypothetical protein [Actinomycetota bacterium]
MKKRIGVLFALLLVAALAMAIPGLSHGGVGTGNCVNRTPQPVAPAGSTVNQTNPVDNGKIWVSSGGEAGTAGPHGYIVANGSGVKGYSVDAPINGQVTTGGACLSVGGNKITAP